MPSLYDMFQPRDPAGEPVGFGDALTSRSNSLIGLGLGLLSPSNPLRGQSSWGQGLEGFQAGAQLDARTAQATAQRAQHAADRRQAQANADRAFAAGQVTDAQRAMRDVLGPNATPEQKSEFMKSYYGSKTDPGSWILKDILDPSDPEGERKITVQEHNRTGQIRPPVLPGQTGTAAGIPPAANWTAGTTNAPVYGATGDYSTPAPAAGIAPAPAPSAIPPAPPGADRKEWKKEQTKLEVQRRTAAEAAKRAGASIDPVTEDIDRAINQISEYPGMTTGAFSSVLKKIPIVGSATQAGEVESLIKTVKANASLDKLQQMRAQSPTGASGLGAVTQGEHQLLQDAIGSLDQAQDSASVLYNLERVKRIRHEIIHGPGTAPPPRFAPPSHQQAPGAGAAQAAPKPGFVKGGYVFKGGDPSQEENWAPVR